MKLWIARDEYGELTLHHNKPEYHEGIETYSKLLNNWKPEYERIMKKYETKSI